MTESFMAFIDNDILQIVDGWRRSERDVPMREEAVRRLIKRGAAQLDSAQLWEIVRFQVLAKATTEIPNSRIPDSYIYAWEDSVYPQFHSHPRMHTPFITSFDVPPDRVTELWKYLDEASETPSNIPSFYKLEDHYDVRRGGGFWTRTRLIRTCRYMYLTENLFDRTVWDSVLAGRDHPTEADYIASGFDRLRDVYF